MSDEAGTAEAPAVPASARAQTPTQEQRLNARRVRPGLFSVLVGDRSFEVVVEHDQGEDGVVVAVIDGVLHPVDVRSPLRKALASVARGDASRGGGSASIAAPMPGRIIAVPVAVGEHVTQGQTVIVLEAMKMESAIVAPRSGTVSEILVAPGQPVQPRQALMRIEAGA